MSDNAIHLVPDTVGEGYKIDVDEVLTSWVGKLTSVALVGFDEHGELIVAGSGSAAESHLLYHQAAYYIVSGSVQPE